MAWLVLAALSAAMAQIAPGEEQPNRFGLSTVFTTSFVSGTRSPGIAGETLDGSYEAGATWNPALNFGLSLSGRYRVDGLKQLSLSYSIRRDLRFNDARAQGTRPGVGGTTSSQVVDTGDLVLGYSDGSVVSWDKAKLHMTMGARWTLPMSRESLVCNPLYSALGVNLGARKVVGPISQVSVSASVDRNFHRYAAAPRGRCGVPLSDYGGTSTLTGTVEPTAYAEEDFVRGVVNPAWVFQSSAGVWGWHGIFGLIPGVADTKAFTRVQTSFGIGLRATTLRRDPEASVETETGSVAVARAASPAVVRFPMSASVGWIANQHLVATLRLSNQVPQLAYDRSAQLRLLPATTSLSLSLMGVW